MKNNTSISKDIANRKIFVSRDFKAPLEKVWQAWTDAKVLDQWWAPRPWKAETKTIDLRAGGRWLYSMVGPEGERHWSKLDFESVSPPDSYSAINMFCDENGNQADDFMTAHWLTRFTTIGNGTNVQVTLTFNDEAGMKKLIAMGFEGGFTMAHGNLDELLAKG